MLELLFDEEFSRIRIVYHWCRNPDCVRVFGRAAHMRKEEPQLLENTCKVTQVLELDELKNQDCLPVLP
jgi:hypothetical protein